MRDAVPALKVERARVHEGARRRRDIDSREDRDWCGASVGALCLLLVVFVIGAVSGGAGNTVR